MSRVVVLKPRRAIARSGGGMAIDSLTVLGSTSFSPRFCGMTGHDLELNESVPDLVVERGGPPRPPPPAPPGSGSQPAPLSRRDAVIILAFLFGPVLVAFAIRQLTSRGPWSPIWQLWIVAVILSIALIAEIIAVASFELWMGVALIGVLLAWIFLCFLRPLRRIDTRS